MTRLSVLMLSGLLFVGAATAKDLAPYGFKKFFDPTRLIQVEIKVKPDDWDRMRKQHRLLVKTLRTDIPPTDQEKPFDYVPAQLTIDGTKVGKVAIRKKGFVGSLDANRPSLKIQIDRYDKKKMFAGVDTLTLNNNRQDGSRVHQLIGYQLFRDAGLQASYCNLAHVTVNGKSLGIYSNVESLDKHLFRRAFDSAKGTLYEGTVCDFRLPVLVRFERKFGSDKADKVLRKAAVALKSGDEKLLKELGRYVDIDRFYKFWAMEVLAGHWDGYVSNRNNYFVYFDTKSDRLHFLPWGVDQLATDRNMFWDRSFDPPKSVKADSAIPRRLYQHPEGRKKYFDAMRLLLKKAWNEKELLAQIDELQELIEPHRVDNNSWVKGKTEAFKKFIRNRREEVTSEFEGGKTPEWTLAQRPLMSDLVKVADANGTFALKLGDAEENSFGFIEVNGTSRLELKWGDKKIDFDKSTFGIRRNGRRSVTLRLTRDAAPEGEPKAIEIHFPQRRIDEGESVPYRLDIFASPAQGNVFVDGSHEPAGNFGGRVVINRFGTETGDAIEGRLESEVFRFLPPKEEE